MQSTLRPRRLSDLRHEVHRRVAGPRGGRAQGAWGGEAQALSSESAFSGHTVPQIRQAARSQSALYETGAHGGDRMCLLGCQGRPARQKKIAG